MKTYRLRTRFVFTSNEPIENRINPHGWQRRILYLRFDNPRERDQQNDRLLDNLRPEFAAIVAAGIREWITLVYESAGSAPQFTEPASSLTLTRDLYETRDSVSAWFADCVTVAAGAGFKPTSALHAHYRRYCEATEAKPKAAARFGRDLTAALAASPDASPARVGKLRGWRGVTLAD